MASHGISFSAISKFFLDRMPLCDHIRIMDGKDIWWRLQDFWLRLAFTPIRIYGKIYLSTTLLTASRTKSKIYRTCHGSMSSKLPRGWLRMAMTLRLKTGISTGQFKCIDGDTILRVMDDSDRSQGFPGRVSKVWKHLERGKMIAGGARTKVSARHLFLHQIISKTSFIRFYFRCLQCLKFFKYLS